ncbi:MAG: ubiquitin family protein, partial [Planctomycetota bacterium]
MARVTIELPTLLSPLADGRTTVAVEAGTVRAALAALIGRYPAIAVHVFDETGDLREHVLCLHNGRNSRWSGAMDA